MSYDFDYDYWVEDDQSVTIAPIMNTSMGPGTPYVLPTPFIVTTAVSSLASIIGSVFIIFVYYRLPEIRSTSRKLLVYLSIADLLNATGNFMGICRYLTNYVTQHQVPCFPPETLCVFQSFLSTIGNLWSFFWTVSMATYLYVVVVAESSAKADRLVPIFHLVSWTIPGKCRRGGFFCFDYRRVGIEKIDFLHRAQRSVYYDSIMHRGEADG